MSLSQHLKPDVSEARMARVWSQIKGRLETEQVPSRRWVPWGAAAGGTALVALAATLLVARIHGAGSALENAALETASDTLAVTLRDGSEVMLASRTRVQVVGGNSEAVTLVVDRGRLSCDVTHRPGRSFVVRASGVEVRVVGTRFSVTDETRADGTHVEVSVERGVVEVMSERHPGEVSRVSAGQTFSELVPSLPAAASASAALAVAVPPSVEPPTIADAPPPGIVAPRPVNDDGARQTREPTARDLLDAANKLRRSGDARGAAEQYGQLLRKFPGDGRAGLAAFELGRLRMDRLGDVAGSIQALERAVQLAPGSGFREDAMARLVTAYASSGRVSDCSRARADYLATFPAGVHRDAVSRGCGSH